MNKTLPKKYFKTVSKSDQNMRLDQFLSKSLVKLTRSRLKSLIEESQVIVNERNLTEPSYRVKWGDKIIVNIPNLIPPPLLGQELPIDIVYEDDDLLVVDKPAGLVVHPAPGNYDKTLVNALIAHCGDSLSGIGGIARPGIVHRLDKDTSGLIVVAKNDQSHVHLSAQFSKRSLDRAYLALVWGIISPPVGEICGNIGRNPRNRKKMAVVKNGGKSALTHYDLKVPVGDFASLVECRLATGRTHQIRVHMAYLGYPIIGDPLYGGKSKRSRAKPTPQFSDLVFHLDRQALHAYLLGFIHPRTGKEMSFKSELPFDIKKLL